MLIMRFHTLSIACCQVLFSSKDSNVKLGRIFIQLHLRFRTKEIWICIVCGTVQCSVILWDLSDIFPNCRVFSGQLLKQRQLRMAWSMFLNKRSDEILRYLVDLCFDSLRALQGSNSSWVLSSSTQMWEQIGAKCALRENMSRGTCAAVCEYGSVKSPSTQARPNLCESCFTFLRRRITAPSQSWRCAVLWSGHTMFKFEASLHPTGC